MLLLLLLMMIAGPIRPPPLLPRLSPGTGAVASSSSFSSSSIRRRRRRAFLLGLSGMGVTAVLFIIGVIILTATGGGGGDDAREAGSRRPPPSSSSSSTSSSYGGGSSVGRAVVSPSSSSHRQWAHGGRGDGGSAVSEEGAPSLHSSGGREEEKEKEGDFLWHRSTPSPTHSPTLSPTALTLSPTLAPTKSPTLHPTSSPTSSPTWAALDHTVPLGVTYSPYHSAMFPGDVRAVMQQDFALIRRHFRQVRTFYTSIFGVPMMDYIAQAGLKAALGVFLFPDNADFTASEVRLAIDAYYKYPANLLSIYVGNEDLIPNGPFSVDQIIGVMQGLRDAGVKTPIGTVQRITEWLSPSPELDRLVSSCDVCGVNIYQFFSAGDESLASQWGRVLARYPGQEHKFRLTETGWPSAGSNNFAGQRSSLGQEQWYYDQYVKWACSPQQGGKESFYFAYFDQRAPTSPDYEQYFGLTDADGNPKFTLVPNGICPST